MNKPQISVIIPTFKPQEYIWSLLDSLRSQVLQSDCFEILIILNGCNEPFRSKIELYINSKLSALTVKLFQTDKPGVSNARNIGIDNARGEFVCFIDDDDIVSPSYLLEMLCIAQKKIIPVSYMLSFSSSIDNAFPDYITRNFELYSDRETCSIFQLRKFMSTSCCKLIPMCAIGDRRFDVSFQNGEDSLFMALISDNIAKLKLTSRDAVYYRRIRGESLSRSQSKKAKVKNGLRLARQFLLLYLKKPHSYNALFYVTRILASLRKVVCAVLQL